MWCLLSWTLVGIGPARAAEPLSLDEVVRAAVSSSPAVARADSDLESARGLSRGRSLFLENPEIEAELAIEGQRSAAEIVQPLSITGEGWFARAEARAEVRATEAARERALLVVAADARFAWADALLSAAQVRITTESLDLASRLRSVVERRTEVGDASALDVALARSAEAHALAGATAARRASIAASLALASFHPGAATRGVQGDPLDAIPPSPPGEPGERRDVAAAVARHEAANAALSRARAAAIPAVGIGGFYEDDGTTTSFGPKVTLEIPLWERNQAAAGDAKGRQRIAVAELRVLESAAQAEIDLAKANATWAYAGWERLDGFDTAALEATTFVTDALERGEIDVRDAVLLQDELFTGRLAAIDATRDAIATALDVHLALGDLHLLPATVTP